MAKIIILITLLPYLLCAMVQSQSSSCSEYFTYITKPGITDILGQIEIRPPSVMNDIFILKVALNTITESPSQVARLELARSIQESLVNVHQGKPLLYHVYYRRTHEPIPSLSAIWFNNQRYCPSPEVSGNITATIELVHILYPPNEEPFPYNYGPFPLISQPWHRNSSTYRIDNPSYDQLNNKFQLNNECGITSYYTDDTNRLIPDLELTLPGQWPWLVAIYQNTDNENVYEFTCAGSLLTTRHVITANFFEKEWNGTRSTYMFPDVDRFYVSFGQFNSREWPRSHTGIVTRAVANFRRKADLVILILKTAIEYNGFIKPVCLWSGSTNLQDIVNMTGYIVGWGFILTRHASISRTYYTYEHHYTGEPRMVKVSLMDISEYPAEGAGKKSFVLTTPENSNHCDLGGGFVISNIHTGRYQLRGVASSCFPCSIYIDVAKYISWIRQQISST